MKKITVSLLLSASMLGGCATPVGNLLTGPVSIDPTPSRDYSIIDPKNVNMVQYEKDYVECASLGNQTDVHDDTVRGIAQGAMWGITLGAVGAAATSSITGDVIIETIVGLGAIQGYKKHGDSTKEQQGAFRKCLTNRGYAVIR